MNYDDPKSIDSVLILRRQKRSAAMFRFGGASDHKVGDVGLALAFPYLLISTFVK
jgi:hypothetical protein